MKEYPTLEEAVELSEIARLALETQEESPSLAALLQLAQTVEEAARAWRAAAGETALELRAAVEEAEASEAAASPPPRGPGSAADPD